jgi:hypothetical protein
LAFFIAIYMYIPHHSLAVAAVVGVKIGGKIRKGENILHQKTTDLRMGSASGLLGLELGWGPG